MKIPIMMAAGVFGGGGAAPVVDPSIVYDTFTAADTTNLHGRSPAPINKNSVTWAVTVGGLRIMSNRASITAIDAGNQCAIIDSGTADIVMTVDVVAPDVTGKSLAAEIYFRYQDTTHFWYVVINATTVLLNEVSVSGAERASGAHGVTHPSTNTATITLSGNNINIKYGTANLSYSSASYNAATKHGIGAYYPSAVTYVFADFDNLRII
jgi:hypothetical protein